LGEPSQGSTPQNRRVILTEGLILGTLILKYQ